MEPRRTPRGVTFTLAIPAGAIAVAPAPLLVSAANAEHLGCTPEQLTTVLRMMAKSPQHRGALVRLPGRKCYAAPPEDVVRYLQFSAYLPVPTTADDEDEDAVKAERRLREAGLLDDEDAAEADRILRQAGESANASDNAAPKARRRKPKRSK